MTTLKSDIIQKWQPMLPMRKAAKKWEELTLSERTAVVKQHPNWNEEELSSARWELISYRKTPGGFLAPF